MTRRDRDRLVVLKKAQKKLITQRQAASKPDVSERQVRRLLIRLKEVGDRAVVHGLRSAGGMFAWKSASRNRPAKRVGAAPPVNAK
jgi:hypothetical protein